VIGGVGVAEVRTLVPGRGTGRTLVLDDPLSFWGGLDPRNGRLIDVHHPQVGLEVTGRVLVMPSGRGSSSSSTVLAEAIRAGTGPAAIVVLDADPIVALGALVAAELYGIWMPVVLADAEAYCAIVPGAPVVIDAGPSVAVIDPVS
jgi:predicted aconitase with swiveling domain